MFVGMKTVHNSTEQDSPNILKTIQGFLICVSMYVLGKHSTHHFQVGFK